ncbi:MAG: thermonuclease family protein, partial [Candidatus Cloacimonetes bacterium]|nr:thermonuclease family protein [Candidatus Cloacimonadota bacterium]
AKIIGKTPDTIKQKLDIEQTDIFNSVYQFVVQKKINSSYHEKVKSLKYIFKDPHKFDKKIDPKQLQFGSKIDKNSSERIDYYSIKNIISPEFLILNNDLKIRLIGIKEVINKREEAIEFLKKKFKGQKIFLKFDEVKYDEENNLLCYVYLKNKTFINTHLIKSALVDVDISYNYKNKQKFINLKGD